MVKSTDEGVDYARSLAEIRVEDSQLDLDIKREQLRKLRIANDLAQQELEQTKRRSSER